MSAAVDAATADSVLFGCGHCHYRSCAAVRLLWRLLLPRLLLGGVCNSDTVGINGERWQMLAAPVAGMSIAMPWRFGLCTNAIVRNVQAMRYLLLWQYSCAASGQSARLVTTVRV